MKMGKLKVQRIVKMTNFMKNIIIFLTVLMSLPNCSMAQDSQQISYRSFKEFELNNVVTLNKLIDVKGNWSIITEALGQPQSKECKEYQEILGFETTCDFFYPGIEIYYTNVGQGVELSTLELTTNEAFLHYKGSKIRIGDPITVLQNSFPEAYQKRGPVTNGGKTRYIISLNVNKSITYLSFRYSNNTKKITEIKLFQILT